MGLVELQEINRNTHHKLYYRVKGISDAQVVLGAQRATAEPGKCESCHLQGSGGGKACGDKTAGEGTEEE